MKSKSILLLTNSNGYGHISAAKAKKKEILDKDTDAKVIEIDIFQDWLGNFGHYTLKRWHKAQRSSDIFDLSFLTQHQYIADKLLFFPIFIRTLKTLINKSIDHIVDTQPIGTHAITKATRLYNRIKRRRIQIEKIITDLPTDKATHFFTPIKSLSPQDRSLIQIVSPKPLEYNEGHFWLNNCNISLDQITYDLPLSQHFKKIKYLGGPIEISLPKRDIKYIDSPLGRASVNGSTYRVAAADRVIMIMLGSHPPHKDTLAYSKIIKEVVSDLSGNYHLFVLCNDKSLQEKISSLGSPSNMSILPLSFQCPENISKIISRTNASITKSGGLTSMELFVSSNGMIWIHNPTTHKKLSLLERTLRPIINLESMPTWEKGNAEYLQKTRGAIYINIDSFKEQCLKFFIKLDRGKDNTNKCSPIFLHRSV